MRTFAASTFALLGFLIASPALAQTPDNNPVIDAYRQQGGGGTPTNNFMYNGYQQHGPGTPDDNFMQGLMSPRQNSDYGRPPVDPYMSPYGGTRDRQPWADDNDQ